MKLKRYLRGLLFSRIRVPLRAEDSPLPEKPRQLPEKLLWAARRGNGLAMQCLAGYFEEGQELFSRRAAELWYLLAARQGSRAACGRLLRFMAEQPGQPLSVPLDPFKGAVNVPGRLLGCLGLLPEECSEGLFYDLLPVRGCGLFLLRSYPDEGGRSWEDGMYQEQLLSRNFSPIHGSCCFLSPDSSRSGRSLGALELAVMLFDTLRFRVMERRDAGFIL